VANGPLGAHLGLTDYADDAAAWRVAEQVRARLMDHGYGLTVYGWVQAVAPECDARDLNRLMQLVELAYSFEPAATTRPSDFIRLVEQRRVEDPTSARVRVMSIHQSKGLQFDVVVLPELDARLVGQTPQVVVGRPKPTAPVECVCRYVNKDLRGLLPVEIQEMFETHERQVVEESLCVLYVAMTRAVHALHLIVGPSAEKEKTVPKSFAGVLRGALTDGSKIEPETVVYEHGRADWFREVGWDAVAGVGGTAQTGEPRPNSHQAPVLLAPSPARPLRGLDRQSPSQLEGGGRVRLKHQLRLDRSALDRGSLMHAWFMLIEWLDDGEPDDATLRRVAADPEYQGLDAAPVLAAFRAALNRPAIRDALCCSTYRRPAARDCPCAVHVPPQVKDPSWRVWRERPFAIRDGDAILSGSIDRLVVLYDGDRALAADVLDFKTDVLPPGNGGALAARVETYRPQLAAYRRAAAAMLQLDPDCISARLAFLEAGVIESV
jgi:ATP-dependent exoDNAse (exonuclease V) beta subunit